MSASETRKIRDTFAVKVDRNYLSVSIWNVGERKGKIYGRPKFIKTLYSYSTQAAAEEAIRLAVEFFKKELTNYRRRVTSRRKRITDLESKMLDIQIDIHQNESLPYMEVHKSMPVLLRNKKSIEDSLKAAKQDVANAETLLARYAAEVDRTYSIIKFSETIITSVEEVKAVTAKA